MSNKARGDSYEIQTRDSIQKRGIQAFLWSHTPETILLNNGIIGSHNINRLIRKEHKINPLRDTGIDVIQVDDNGVASLVQCKNGYKKGLLVVHLAGFNAWMNTLIQLQGYVYYTHKLSVNIESLPSSPRILYIKQAFIEDTVSTNIISSTVSNSVVKFEPDKTKLAYQTIAYNLAVEYYKTHSKGVITAPCATGKTYMSYMISQGYQQIIIVSPLQQFATQNLHNFVKYGYQYKTLLVDTEGTRDPIKISEFIKSNKNFLISVTYDSMDVIYKLFDLLKDSLFIVDEFHNLSKNNVCDKNNDFYKIIYHDCKPKMLFMSATPRIYELEKLELDEPDACGDIIYKMSFKEAIENKYITDYQLWLPSIHEDTSKLDKELSIYDIDSVIKAKSTFLFSCLLNNGSRKTIVYCSDRDELDKLMNSINALKKFYYLDIKTAKITYETKYSDRLRILEEFSRSMDIYLLFAIKILDECVDIPLCDSVYITYPSHSKIRNVQRLCRCVRTTNDKFKVGNIFIWCDDYDMIVDTLSGIKEYDENFAEKVKINQNNFYGKLKSIDFDRDRELIKKYMVDIKEYKHLAWIEKFNIGIQHLDDSNIHPSTKDPDPNVRRIAKWFEHWFSDYKNNIGTVSNEVNRIIWEDFLKTEKYMKLFPSNKDEWRQSCGNVLKYINDKDGLPPYITKKDKYTDEEIEIKVMRTWIDHQKPKYDNRKGTIMENQDIYDEWTDIIRGDKYKKYFLYLFVEETWNNNFIKSKDYMINKTKRPPQEVNEKNKNDENIEEHVKLGIFMSNNNQHYIKKEGVMSQYDPEQGIMVDTEYYHRWSKLREEFKQYFKEDPYDFDKWHKHLEALKPFIIENKDKFITITKAIDKVKYNWIIKQHSQYTKIDRIMNVETIREEWRIFTSDPQYNKCVGSVIEPTIELYASKAKAKADKDKAKADKDKAKADKDKAKADKDKAKADKDKVKADKDKVKADKDKVKSDTTNFATESCSAKPLKLKLKSPKSDPLIAETASESYTPITETSESSAPIAVSATIKKLLTITMKNKSV